MMTTPDEPAEAEHSDALGLLGLARRAGALETGTSSVRTALRVGRAHLVVVASDAAEGQAGKVIRLARARERPVRRFESRVLLGRILGAPPLTAVAVTDAGLAEEILRRWNGSRSTGTDETDRERSV
jgi:ribosomal protein L7Ae-like RNA K-turn-binding protein